MVTRETSVMDELRDLTECSICNNMISDPRGLPCIHTFCLKCLENFESSSGKKPADKMLCPVCRKEFTIPPEGMNGLQKNFFVERLAELMTISKPIGNVSGCDACKVSNCSTEMEAEASEYCIQCREKLCSRCSMEHLRNKFSRSHQVVQMGCDVTEFMAEQSYSSVCDLHSEETTKMYCVECKVVICMMCFAESHNTHKCMDVKKAGEKFQKEIETDIKKLIDFSRETLDKKEQLEQEKKKFLKELQDTERMIKCKCKTLKDLAEKYANDLLDELNSVEQKRFKVMDSRKEEVERHLESVDRFNTYGKEITSKGSPSDICRAVNDLHMRAEELQKLHEIHIRQRSSSRSISFKELEIHDICAKNLIGEIKETSETEKAETSEKETSETVAVRSKTATRTLIWSAAGVFVCLFMVVVFRCELDVNVIPGAWLKSSCDEIFGENLKSSCDDVLSIAFTKTAINVLCNNYQKQLLIYDSQSPFPLRGSLSLSWMTKPETIVGSLSSDSLYVTDSESDCVWIIYVYREGSNYHKTKWMCEGDLRILSLSGDGSTMLATNGYFWTLKLYKSEYALLLHRFELPVDTYGENAVRTSEGNFVVSCRSRVGNVKSICKFSKLGYLVECYALQKSSEELNRPIHLSLTSDNKVIVADTSNNRILLLNSDLTWNRVFLSKDGDGAFIEPILLSYNIERKLLVVVNRNGDILVYDSYATGL